jgi:hypothetical protein
MYVFLNCKYDNKKFFQSINQQFVGSKSSGINSTEIKYKSVNTYVLKEWIMVTIIIVRGSRQASTNQGHPAYLNKQ